MIVYHGSNAIVPEPKLLTPTRFLDFGKGFYTTLSQQQAIIFADKVFQRRKVGVPTVSIYEFDKETVFSTCSLLQFCSPNEKWLNFVSANRDGTYRGVKYELIYGAVANDDVFTTLSLYTSGQLSKEETLNRLKIKELYNQLVFGSQRALLYLKFIGTMDGEEYLFWKNKQD